ncbi:hypothetical protein FACS1894158_13030 [Betaproteobacteria bacterium]|nr:hypothetical protein FACS1894158_13030 [Betaproteobacteria bacterium]
MELLFADAPENIELKNALGDEALYQEALAEFVEGHANDVARLRECLAASDKASAYRIAHTLKSSAATIGAMDLCETAANLESEIEREIEEETGGLPPIFAIFVSPVSAIFRAIFRAISPPVFPEGLLAELDARLAAVMVELDEPEAVELDEPGAVELDEPEAAPSPSALPALPAPACDISDDAASRQTSRS